MIIQLTVAIQIEIVNHKDEVLGRHFSVAIFPFELADLFGAYISGTVSINPFESGIGFKIANGSKDLPHFLDSKLLFGHEQEQFFEFQL